MQEQKITSWSFITVLMSTSRCVQVAFILCYPRICYHSYSLSERTLKTEVQGLENSVLHCSHDGIYAKVLLSYYANSIFNCLALPVLVYYTILHCSLHSTCSGEVQHNHFVNFFTHQTLLEKQTSKELWLKWHGWPKNSKHQTISQSNWK